tara:strand:- start:43 stop:213 length:171 start_codon:yes stop_codon:yes gene_type:complete
MSRKKVKSWTSSTGTTPADWGIKDPDAPFKSPGPSIPINKLLKKAKLKGERKGYNV